MRLDIDQVQQGQGHQVSDTDQDQEAGEKRTESEGQIT
jgi:hypothetical protein